MDLSKGYIKMCDCPEIQDMRAEYSDLQNFVYSIRQEPVEIADTKCFPLKEVWLPRQDQLQEMLEEGFDIIFGDFYRFASAEKEGHDEVLKYKSYEQLWLAFVMWEKHRMSWTGSEWVRAHWTKEEEKMIKEDKRQPIILKGLI